MWPGVPLLCCPDPHHCSQVGIKTPLLAHCLPERACEEPPSEPKCPSIEQEKQHHEGHHEDPRGGMGHDSSYKQHETEEDAYGHRYRECRGNPSPGEEQGDHAQQPDQQSHGKGDDKENRALNRQTVCSK